MSHVAPTTVRFFVEGVPVPQGSMRSPRPGVVLHSNPALAGWRDEVSLEARTHFPEPWEGAVEVYLDFYLPRGKTVTREEPSVKPDLDKLVRAVLDALEGVAYVNDAQVVRITALKVYGDPDVAGVNIELERV